MKAEEMPMTREQMVNCLLLDGWKISFLDMCADATLQLLLSIRAQPRGQL